MKEWMKRSGTTNLKRCLAVESGCQQQLRQMPTVFSPFQGANVPLTYLTHTLLNLPYLPIYTAC